MDVGDSLVPRLIANATELSPVAASIVGSTQQEIPTRPASPPSPTPTRSMAIIRTVDGARLFPVTVTLRPSAATGH